MKKEIISAIAVVCLTSSALASNCKVSVSQIQNQLPFAPVRMKIVKEKQLNNGVCSVIVKVRLSPRQPTRYVPLFVLKNGGVIIGTYFKNKQNITGNEIYRVKQAAAEKTFEGVKNGLKEAVMAYYKPGNFNGKILYAFVDPLCPFCRMAERHLKQLANESGYEIALIPFIVHGKPAEQAAMDFICNHKTFDDYLKGKWGGKKTCEAGKKIIRKGEGLAEKLNVDGTPTFFTSTGKRVVGANIESLKRVMGIKQ